MSTIAARNAFLLMLGGAFLLLPLPGARGQPTAEFSTLTVKVSGSGKVTSSPAGINCPPTCEKTVATGTKITLTVTPSAGYVFSKWTGSCAGTSKTCAVLMTANKNVFAWFVVAGRPPPPPPPPKPPPPPGPGPPPPPAPPPPPPAGKPRCAKDVACFDDLAAGTKVTKHYIRIGLELGYAVSNDKPGTVGGFPVVGKDSLAKSGGQVGRVGGCGKEFCPSATIYGRLAKPRKWIEVWVGGGAEVSVVGRTASFALIVSAYKIAQTSPNSLTLVRIEASSHEIAYFQIGENAPDGSQRGTLVIDDLAVSPPDPNAKPDFGLTWTPLLPSQPLAVPMPGQVTTRVALTRTNGSTGGIDFKTSFTAPQNAATTGIEVKVSPPTASTSTSQVLVTLKADANAVIPRFARLVLTGDPSNSAGSSDRKVEISLAGRLSAYDVVVTGIEVTQGIQVQQTPYYDAGINYAPDVCKAGENVACPPNLFDQNVCATMPSLPARDMDDISAPVHYKVDESASMPQWLLGPAASVLPQKSGVTLVAGRPTIVRVFASLVGAAADKGVVAGQLRLYGKRNGKPISDYVSPEYSPSVIKGSDYPYVTCDQRADGAGAYTFTLPAAWTDGSLELRAELVPEGVVFGEGGECGSETCVANNSLVLDRIGFTDLGYTTITPVAVRSPFVPDLALPLPDPSKVFAEMFFHMPGRQYFSEGSSATSYAGVIDVSWIATTDLIEVFEGDDEDDLRKARSRLILGEVVDWGEDNTRGDQTVGIHNDSAVLWPGMSHSGYRLHAESKALEIALNIGSTFAVASATAGMTIVHELFHGVGRAHADTACGGDSNGQNGVSWLPDQRGQIHGFGLDPRDPRQGVDRILFGPYRVIVPEAATSAKDSKPPKEWVDIMSYCKKYGATRWQSVRGWNDTVRMLRAFHKARGRVAATASARTPGPAVLRVSALASHRGVAIVKVAIGNRRSGRGGIASPYRLVARGKDGRVLGSSALRYTSGVDTPAIGLVEGEAPPAASIVEIVRNGAVVARRARSTEAPTVRILAPRAGARAGTDKTVNVRWSQTDKGRDRLVAKLHYSIDAGRNWRLLSTGSTRDRVSLPSSLFAGSKRARIRVTVSDGFNERSAMSGIFTAVARKPTVRILSPARRQRFPGDSTLYLAGEAYDDRGTVLRGKRLTWFDGRRKLGAGERISISGLHPGMRVLRLRADDGRGGVANAFVRVQLTSTRPHLLSLKAPGFVNTGARSVALRLATTVPATVQVGRQTFQVGPKPKAISVRVTPGRQRLEVALRLSARGRTNTVTLVIRRR